MLYAIACTCIWRLYYAKGHDPSP